MPNPMIPRERADYSAIVDRPPLKLPGKARIVFWTIVNYEVWDIHKPMARQVLPAPTGMATTPDVVHWGFHEYGMRVGCWRFFELFKRLGIRPTLAANARICEDYPRVAEEARTNGWEFMGHAYEQGPIHKEEDQAGMIARTMGIITKFAGKKPVGWLGPGLTQTMETPDLLAAAGIKYIGDWVYDDEPTTIHVIGLVDGIPAGAVRLYPLGDRLWKGDRLAVLHRYRRAGIGRPLVKCAVALAASLGGIRMDAQIQLPNVNFFKILGWSPDGKPAEQFGVLHQHMSIPLR